MFSNISKNIKRQTSINKMNTHTHTHITELNQKRAGWITEMKYPPYAEIPNPPVSSLPKLIGPNTPLNIFLKMIKDSYNNKRINNTLMKHYFRPEEHY